MNNRRALVCGASQGIGLACAQLLAAAGVQVLLLARGAEKLQCALATLVPHPAGHRSLALDVNALDALVQAITAELQHGTIDILINNTGGPPPGPIASATSAQFQAAFHQHLLVNHALAGLLVPGMRASGFGRIVNVISTSVKEPLRDLGVSNTVRAAVAAWAKTLAGEVAPFGITVNNVLPGYTKTARLEAIVQARNCCCGGVFMLRCGRVRHGHKHSGRWWPHALVVKIAPACAKLPCSGTCRQSHLNERNYPEPCATAQLARTIGLSPTWRRSP
jgi:3-oxoacyl-[acyl-carrier protein] reductase